MKDYKYSTEARTSTGERYYQSLIWEKYTLLEKLRHIQGKAFPWEKYIDMAKTGFLYRDTMYTSGWGFPRKDPFPSMIFYPLKDSYLVVLIIHLEKLFPKKIRAKINVPYYPFGNIKMNSITYVSYSSTESRQIAHMNSHKGWTESSVTSLLRDHQKIPSYGNSKWEIADNPRCRFVSQLLEQHFHYLRKKKGTKG
jgi:hypothetical protein